MSSIAVSKVLEALLRVWEALISFASGVFDVMNTSVEELVTTFNYFQFTNPFWEWLLNETGIGDYTLFDFIFGAIAFFVGYTILKWFTDVVA